MKPSVQPPAPLRQDLKSEWLLDPRIAFLNHGSFGAVPRCVLAEQSRWQARIEAEPVELLGRQAGRLLEKSRQAVGQWLGMRPEDFGFVTNATEGINAVLQSIKLVPGDELLTTTHVYNAVRQAMRHAASRTSTSYREIRIPLPIRSADELIERVVDGLSPTTRLLVIDHITSPTAIIFPVGQIALRCAERDIDVLIDGAHAPSMVPLNVPQIGATFYAGNLHKWGCAPKGSAFLWARQDSRADLHPLVISHYLGEGFAREFAWQGTRDISNWLSIPRAMQFLSDIGWEKIRAYNHGLTVWMQQMFCERWDIEPTTPADGSLLGSMAAIPLPAPLNCLSESEAAEIQQTLYDRYLIEAPIMRWNDRVLIRPCCQIYNTPEDYERLAVAVLEIRRDRDKPG